MSLPNALRQKLESVGQQHVLRFFDQLNWTGQRKLLQQLSELDLPMLGQLAHSHVVSKPPVALPRDIQPVAAYPHQPDAKLASLYKRARQRGRELLEQGKIAALLVAGGQGTRLGYPGPKGEFPVTPIKNKPLFQVFAEQLLAHSRDARRAIPWYIMTSNVNDASTRAFFASNNFFSYDPAHVFFFQQGMMPAFSMDGKLLLEATDSLALGPDGHGGSLRALDRSGALKDMLARGTEHISYFQVDNPLVHAIDPPFLGLHDLTGSEMSSKTVAKAGALERVGNFVRADGVVQVIEYSDLPKELALQTNADGSLKFNAGSIAIHAITLSFVRRLTQGGELGLPWHRAEKKVPYIDENGKPISPQQPNAVKLEQFVFDAIPLAKNPLVYTTERAEEFSPVKNAEGSDSPATSRRDQIRRAARWLRHAGLTVPNKGEEPDAVLEISPLLATSAEQFAQRKPEIPTIPPAANLYFGEKGVERG